MTVLESSELLQELEQLRREVAQLKYEQHLLEPPSIGKGAAKELTPAERQRKQEFARGQNVPGRSAPGFNLAQDFLALGNVPWGDPLTPTYLLDRNYRIVDWNTAFGIAFDHSMDGRRGLSVLEWVYFLDNYEESLRTASVDFANPAKLPRVHVEPIHYTSQTYGPIRAVKRAYQIPGDTEELIGWLVALTVDMESRETTLRFKRDLLATLRRELVWAEYAMSCDQVLLSTCAYPGLIRHILGSEVPDGGEGELSPIREESRILDLGAGTGNIAFELASRGDGHVVFAVENNQAMLGLLMQKCREYLRMDDAAPGILAIKQDVNVLFGLPEASFDYAILNNVAYALEDPLPCLRQVRKRLAPGGEVRLSGPKRTTDLTELFNTFESELDASGHLARLRDDLTRVRVINESMLRPMLYRWSVDDVRGLLKQAGFSDITYASDSAYAGQGMVVAARK